MKQRTKDAIIAIMLIAILLAGAWACGQMDPGMQSMVQQ